MCGRMDKLSPKGIILVLKKQKTKHLNKKNNIFLSGRICLPGQPVDRSGQVLDAWTVTGQVPDSVRRVSI